MKKLLLASAVAALSISAQAAPTVYGKVFLSLDAVKDGRTQLNSNASRIGFRGAESVNDNTEVVYQLEYGVKVDDNSTQFGSRDTYIGLKHKQFGTVVAGRLTSIDSSIDYVDQISGGAATKTGIIATYDGKRANNAIAYTSPDYSGLTFKGMYVLDESGKNKVLATDSLGHDAFGLAVQYEPKDTKYRGGASYIQAGKTKVARVSGAFDVSESVTIGALHQTQHAGSGTSKESSYSVSGTLKTTTPWSAYAQYDKVSNLGNVKDTDAQRIAVGGKYKFSDNAIGHLYGATREDSESGVDTKKHSIGAGLEYKF